MKDNRFDTIIILEYNKKRITIRGAWFWVIFGFIALWLFLWVNALLRWFF